MSADLYTDPDPDPGLNFLQTKSKKMLASYFETFLEIIFLSLETVIQKVIFLYF